MANLWVTRKEEVRQALHIAQEAKRLSCAIKTLGYTKLAEAWEQESDLLVQSFELFIANAASILPAYHFQAWIDVPQIHLNDMKKIMKGFGVNVETLIAPLPQPEPEPVVEQRAMF